MKNTTISSGCILYGIKQCDTVKKARKWLQSQGVEFIFHDMRTDGLDNDELASWIKSAGWETLLNRRSTTWRQLADSDKNDINQSRASKLMSMHPTLIKRPVLVLRNEIHVGFKPAEYEELF